MWKRIWILMMLVFAQMAVGVDSEGLWSPVDPSRKGIPKCNEIRKSGPWVQNFWYVLGVVHGLSAGLADTCDLLGGGGRKGFYSLLKKMKALCQKAEYKKKPVTFALFEALNTSKLYSGRLTHCRSLSDSKAKGIKPIPASVE